MNNEGLKTFVKDANSHISAYDKVSSIMRSGLATNSTLDTIIKVVEVANILKSMIQKKEETNLENQAEQTIEQKCLALRAESLNFRYRKFIEGNKKQAKLTLENFVNTDFDDLLKKYKKTVESVDNLLKSVEEMKHENESLKFELEFLKNKIETIEKTN